MQARARLRPPECLSMGVSAAPCSPRRALFPPTPRLPRSPSPPRLVPGRQNHSLVLRGPKCRAGGWPGGGGHPVCAWGRGVVRGGHQVPPRGPLGADVFSWSSPGIHCWGQKSWQTRPQPPATSPRGHSSRGSPSWGPLPSNLCPEAPAGRGRGSSSARTHEGPPRCSH